MATRLINHFAMRFWLKAMSFSGLVLFICCLFPAVEECGTVYTPAKEWVELSRSLSDVDSFGSVCEFSMMALLFVPAYVLGGVAFIAASAALFRKDTVGTAAMVSLILLTSLTLVALALFVAAFVLPELSPNWSPTSDQVRTLLRFIGLLFLGLHAILANWKDSRDRFANLFFFTAAFATGWFIYCHSVYSPANQLYGLQISLAASALLLISVTGIAYARSRLGFFKTIGLLLTARLNRAAEDGHCIQCGYNLFGLTEPRCPECGTPFEIGEERIEPPSHQDTKKNAESNKNPRSSDFLVSL